MFKRRVFIFISLLSLFVISFSMSYMTYDYLFNPGKKPTPRSIRTISNNNDVIKANNIIKKIEKYECGNKIVEIIKTEPWMGKTYVSLEKEYPADKGWSINVEEQNIVLSKSYNQLCPYHNQKHFGIYQNKLAIFEGPLGNNEKVLEVESNIDINNLPEDFLKKLKEASQFNYLNATISQDLRNELEFANDVELDEAIQNLDEFME